VRVVAAMAMVAVATVMVAAVRAMVAAALAEVGTDEGTVEEVVMEVREGEEANWVDRYILARVVAEATAAAATVVVVLAAVVTAVAVMELEGVAEGVVRVMGMGPRAAMEVWKGGEGTGQSVGRHRTADCAPRLGSARSLRWQMRYQGILSLCCEY